MMAFMQDIPFPTSDMNPWIWFTGVAALAIGVLAKFIRDNYEARLAEQAKGYDARVGRCEGREDKLIDDNRACIASSKDMLAATIRAVELAETATTLHRQTNDKIDANRASIDAVKTTVNDALRAFDEMRRAR